MVCNGFRLLAALAMSVLVLLSTVRGDDRPNIVIMMADDMGFSDIGCYGGEIETPNLDRLATNGLRFTQFYNTGRCCPTRAALLTGLYPHQAGIGHMMEDRGLIGYQGDLNRSCRTIPQVLQPAGYATYMSGKWHVTKKIGPNLQPGDQRNWPRQRGFDRFFGTIHGAGSFFDPNSLTRDNRLIAPGTGKTSITPTRSAITPCSLSRSMTVAATLLSCTSRTLHRIGRCMPSRKTSRSTRVDISKAGTNCDVLDING